MKKTALTLTTAAILLTSLLADAGPAMDIYRQAVADQKAHMAEMARLRQYWMQRLETARRNSRRVQNSNQGMAGTQAIQRLFQIAQAYGQGRISLDQRDRMGVQVVQEFERLGGNGQWLIATFRQMRSGNPSGNSCTVPGCGCQGKRISPVVELQPGQYVMPSPGFTGGYSYTPPTSSVPSYTPSYTPTSYGVSDSDDDYYRDNAAHQMELAEIDRANGNYESAESHLYNAEYDLNMVSD